MLSVASTNVQGKMGVLGTDTFWLQLNTPSSLNVNNVQIIQADVTLKF
jgi:hypothetical protein